MHALNTVPDAACVSGIVFPATIPQFIRQPLPAPIREALVVELEQSLLRYLHSGLFRSRAVALQKWLAARNGVRGLRQALRGQQDVRRLIYKEPFLSFAPDYAFEALPGARFVYLYRDGRDCADSLARTYGILTDARLADLRSTEARLGRRHGDRYVPWWVDEGRDDAFLAATPYGRAAWMWKEMVRRCHTFFARPEVAASGQVLALRYEDLMREPLAHGGAVAAHLGVPLNRRFRRRLEEAHTRSIGAYERRGPLEVREAERIAGEELRLLGYL
jgi:hypothetical protein